MATRLSAEGLLRPYRLLSRRMRSEVLSRRQRSERADETSARSAGVAWLRAHEPEVAVDPVILGELRYGILILPKGGKRAALKRWFDAGVGRLHCLAWDADTGLKWAELLARLRRKLIAATAVVHDLAVATRNRADFVNAGVRIVDPFVG